MVCLGAMAGSFRAVFLDRDDTIIHNSGDLGDPSAVRLIDDAATAIKSLQDDGYLIVIVSNQGGVARGKYGEADVDAVNQRIARLVHEASGAVIDRFYYCPFHPDGTVPEYACEHPWRKPQPGMLLQAAEDLDLDLTQCWMIGDQERDVAAGQAAGCRTVLVATGRRPPDATRALHVTCSLTDAAGIILNGTPPGVDVLGSTSDLVPEVRRSESGLEAKPASNGDEVMRRISDLHAEVRAIRSVNAEFTAGRLLTMIAMVLVLGLAVGFALYLEPLDAMMWGTVAITAELVLIGLFLVFGRGR